MNDININAVVDEGAAAWPLPSISTEDTARWLLRDICCEIDLLLSHFNNSAERSNAAPDNDFKCLNATSTDPAQITAAESSAALQVNHEGSATGLKSEGRY